MPTLRRTLSGKVQDTSKPIRRRSLYLSNDNNGTRFLFEFGFPYSFPAQSAPANNAIIKDIGEISADGRIQLGSGKTIGFTGKGLDFSTYTNTGGAAPSYAELNAAATANIWSGGSSSHQVFLIFVHIKLPLLADWNVTGSIMPFVQFATTSAGYTTDVDLLSMGMATSGIPGGLTARRQTNGASTVDALSITPASSDYGGLAQLAFWRNDTGQGLRLKTTNGTVQATGVKGVNNTGDFSARTMKVGIGPGFWPNLVTDAQMKWKLYGGGIENLRTSARDPVTVLDAEWTRFLARGAS